MNEYVFDIEANGLTPDKIHCMVLNTAIEGFGKLAYTDNEPMSRALYKLSDSDYLIGHNIVQYDIPVLKKLLNIDIKAKLVDTLALSWYLFPNRVKHGLESWGEDFGIPKPIVKKGDWKTPVQVSGQSDYDYKRQLVSHQELMLHRCKEDVKINTMLWELMKKKLEQIYGVDGYWGLIEYLTFKMDCARLQEETKWKLDVPKSKELLSLLEERQVNAKQTLQSVMPKIKKFTKKKRPAKPYNQDGELSATGIKWKELTEEHNLPFDYSGVIEVFHSLQEPNAGSSKQVKDWLDKLGWKPSTFKFVREGERERKIPQIKTNEGELCQSIERMVGVHKELSSLSELGVLSHRIGIIKGFLKDEVDGYVVAGIQGLTNTLRFKHRTCVNIPSSRKPYGTEIRSLLTANDGYELVGSDMSNLEGRIKEHYVYPHDPDFVNSVNSEGYDGHLAIAVQAGMMTEDEAEEYKSGNHSERLSAIRHGGKQASYSCQYGAGASTIARQAGISVKEAKKLHKAYWDINWAVKTVAEEQKVKIIEGSMWLYNPVSKLWYNLRSDKDRFSTLVQGTGTYCFDMWMKELVKKGVKLNANFHDEVVVTVKKGFREQVTKDFKEAVGRVNDKLSLNRDLDVDVDFGDNYSEIH